MLDEFQINQVWENMLAAEARSLYFGDLAARYTRRKQWITGASFFLASGAAATVVARASEWVPGILALSVALANAYSMAVNLDRKTKTMSTLHASWNRIGADYGRLWSHTYSDDAEEQMYEIVERAREASELATTEAPNDQKLLGKWQDRVFALHNLTGQHG
ncbi:MAG: hypothetical protein EXQ47_10055 [Bryobacterales bacterium]|nr:hypothetical protein [Bryobacterales bacterium]